VTFSDSQAANLSDAKRQKPLSLINQYVHSDIERAAGATECGGAFWECAALSRWQ